MQAQNTAEVVFDCMIHGLDRRLAGPTTGLVERVLDEAGLEGVWTLRDSRRIRRKGRGRFSTMRVESRGGSKSIRMWCKPQGNDTAFEYSLHPPKDVDIDLAYSILSRVNPVTLQIPESRKLPGAVLGRLVGVEPIGGLERKGECLEVVEPTAEADQERESAKNPPIADGERLDTVLELDPSWTLSCDEAVDRALMAIAFVAEGGYARKSEASASIIESLGVKGFAAGASESYTSVEGSMRALTMALWKRKRYIERITANSRGGGGPSDSIRGYRITPKGERRLEVLAEKFGPDVKSRMNANWRRDAAGVSQSQVSSVLSPAAPKSLSELKELVASHDEAEKQIREMDGLVSLVDSDIDSLRSEMDSLDAEIARMNEAKAEIARRISAKEEEKREWERMKAVYEGERVRIEGLVGVRSEP
jgi:DNA-binding PadR family transcriptional regulator